MSETARTTSKTQAHTEGSSFASPALQRESDGTVSPLPGNRSDIQASLMRRASGSTITSTSTTPPTMADPVYGATLNQPPQSSTAHSGFTPTPNVAVTIPVVHGRAMEQRLHEIFAHENEAQTVKRQARPDEAVAKTSAPVPAVPEPATVSSAPTIQRKEDMLREVQELAQRFATPGANLNAAAAQAEIVKIRQRYGALTDVHPEEISSNFERAFEESYDEKVKTLPWYKRAYYGTRDVVKGGAKLLGDVGSWLADKSASAATTTASFVKEAVTDPAKTMMKIADAGSAALDKAGDLLNAMGDTLSAAGLWVKNNGLHVLSKGGELAASSFKAGWEVIKGVGHGFTDVGGALIGQKRWSEVGHNFMGALGRAGNHAKEGWDIVCAGACMVGSAAVLVWHGVKTISDSLGVSDLLVGVGHSAALVPHLMLDAGKILIGQGSFADLHNNAMGHIKGAGNGVLGAGKCLVEVTGLADLYRAGAEGCQALAAYGRGHIAAAKQHGAMAAMHGAFAAMSIGSIAATVGTGGAAAGSIVAVAAGRATVKQAAKVVLKEGAEQFFKKGAAEIGDVALKELIQNAPKALASREGGAALLKQAEVHASITGKSVADIAYRELLRVEAKSGAIQTAKTMAQKGIEGASLTGAEAIARDVGESRTKSLLKELGLNDIVDKHTFDLLTKGADTDLKALAKELGEKYSLSADKAKSMAKEVKETLRSGKSDAELKQILEDGIHKPISDSLAQGMEKEYKATMRKAVRGECDELGEASSKQLKEAVERNAEKSGKTLAKYEDDLVEATWKGYREGIEAGTRAVVREGIEQAFKRFRDRDSRHRAAGGPVRASNREGGEETVAISAAEKEGASKQQQEIAERTGHENMTRQRTVTGPEGEIIHITETFDSNKNQWTVVDTDIERIKAA